MARAPQTEAEKKKARARHSKRGTTGKKSEKPPFNEYGFKRLTNNFAEDADGNRIRTNKDVKNIGAGQGKGGGQPREFKDPDIFKTMYNIYIQDIVDNDFFGVPTLYGFSRFTGIEHTVIYDTVNKYYPELQKWISEVNADLMQTGAMLGYYKEVSTIFALKNRCNWADKKEVKTTNNSSKILDSDQAQKVIEEYVKTLPQSKDIQIAE